MGNFDRSIDIISLYVFVYCLTVYSRSLVKAFTNEKYRVNVTGCNNDLDISTKGSELECP